MNWKPYEPFLHRCLAADNATLRAELEEALGLLGRARQWLPVVGDGGCQPPEIEPLCDEIDALYDSAKGSLWWE